MRMRSELRSKCLPLSLGEGRNSQASSLKDKKDGNYSSMTSMHRVQAICLEDMPLFIISILSHFPGPVTFSAECSKHFHRLYHNTRDCSTPACKLSGQTLEKKVIQQEMHIILHFNSLWVGHNRLNIG